MQAKGNHFRTGRSSIPYCLHLHNHLIRNKVLVHAQKAIYSCLVLRTNQNNVTYFTHVMFHHQLSKILLAESAPEFFSDLLQILSDYKFIYKVYRSGTPISNAFEKHQGIQWYEILCII
ncbi:hypothetical protein NPIL_390431 [Nephila pilipes]|uniref:Uncharacterized protein n=1 Tax=Nephila pilipes TaxID=299642 RepID=A0A8X6NGX4_NEPPI|nr:hypothetical protein NPIL_390431 [Nephila pilipes]